MPADHHDAPHLEPASWGRLVDSLDVANIFVVIQGWLGDKLRAFVVVRDGATLEAQALGAFLKDRIAAYKIPDDIRFRADLPRSSAGKVLKEALRGS